MSVVVGKNLDPDYFEIDNNTKTIKIKKADTFTVTADDLVEYRDSKNKLVGYLIKPSKVSG